VIEPGARIGGFEVQEMLGRGGMAVVYRATQVRLQRPVALKVLNPVLATDESFVQRFHAEGINSARLEHPNIVPVYEAGEDGGYAFLAIKLVEGETMGSYLERRGALPPHEALTLLADVAEALEYAHGVGFIHRDVKPGNVLIDMRGHVYLSDFGLSKALGTTGLTSTGQWMGTAEYMAPEQARGGEVDRRVDLYALGCMAFECLTGRPPFEADDLVVMIMAHATREVPSVARRARLFLTTIRWICFSRSRLRSRTVCSFFMPMTSTSSASSTPSSRCRRS
jgi:serine/threonine protein kinase